MIKDGNLFGADNLLPLEQSLVEVLEGEKKKRDAFIEQLANILSEHPIMKLNQD
ncbi:hypothetical protein KM915_11980 [Cytobacillus oceanisediminis]|uniref:hypothetical protein n=1 Tax=Cytobacillus oceanisediminis TaxID=665099 RepID=UPI001C21F1CF|nr:hypothetical protein [Cytobacillus oceanisediminis]MBU8730771.1 hypothetical protein [Cytobacillus oceanisediminis]